MNRSREYTEDTFIEQPTIALSRVSDIQAMIAQQDRMAAASERLVQSLMAEVFQ